jgi:hypothetical protein
MKQKVIMTRIGVLSTAKIIGIIYFALGLIIGIPLGIIGAVSGTLTEGLMLIVVFPVMYGAMGVLSGLILTVPYNLLAQKIGGIEYETEIVEAA